jgi:hypothetical protein
VHKSVDEDQIQALNIVQELLPWREQLAGGFGTRHGNCRLELIDGLIVLLAAFFNPMVRSQRLIEALSAQQWMQKRTSIDRIAKSTLSDAMKRFDPQSLRPVIADLVRRVPALGRRDPELLNITRRIIAADGSMFQTLGDVAWAMHSAHKKPDKQGKRQNQVRLNLQLDVDSFTPLDADISGKDDPSEPTAFIRNLHGDVIYVVDRGFVSYAFLNAVLKQNSNFVLRLRKDVGINVDQVSPLTPEDINAGIISDERVHFRGATDARNAAHQSFTDKPPEQELRRVVVRDGKGGTITLITDLLDVPAWVIAALYRLRWQIELFFKWLKSYAAMDHLISHHPNGVTLQFYIAIIATLLLHLATGRRVSKYALFWLGSVANGQASFQQMRQGLARIEREKELERKRKAKKAVSKIGK